MIGPQNHHGHLRAGNLGSFSHYLPIDWFCPWLAGFLNHQQYHGGPDLGEGTSVFDRLCQGLTLCAMVRETEQE